MRLRVLAVSTLLLLPLAANARDAFLLTLNVDPSGVNASGSTSFSDLDTFVNVFNDAGFRTLVPAYNPRALQQVHATLDIRGLPAFVDFATGSAALVFRVPALGIVETFNGRTRLQSERLFRDWWRGQGSSVVSRLLQELVAATPIDPVAGNPNSLMANMAAADFAMGGNEYGEAGAGATFRFSANAGYGSFSSGAFDGKVYGFRLGASFRLPDSGVRLLVDLPFSYVDASRTESYNGSLGLGVRIPVTADWFLTPAFRVGGAGSYDLGAAALIYSGSLVSNYNVSIDEFRLQINNMAGFYQADSVTVGKYNLNYNLTNYVLRNGVTVDGPLPFEIAGYGTGWQASAVYTKFFGDRLYIDSYAELTLAFGLRDSPGSTTLDNLQIGATGIIGENDYRAFRVSLGYRF